MNFQKAEATFVKPVMAGAIAAGIGAYQYPGNSVTVFGTSLPVWAVLRGTTAVSTLAGSVAGNYVIPYIPSTGNQTFQTLIDTGLNPALAGGANLLTQKVLIKPSLSDTFQGMPPVESLAIGAGSYMAADYLNRRFFGNTY